MRYSKLAYTFPRRIFDPSKKEDIAELKYFLKHNKWKNYCPFYAVYPWEDIPAMCLEIYAKYSLGKLK